MTYSLVIREIAAADILAAKQSYNELRPGLGNDFALCVEEAIARILHFPLSYAKVGLDLRRVLVHRFPFAIYFRVDGREITVHGVFPNRQNPDVWQQRRQ